MSTSAADGTLVVIDYKTGSTRSYTGLDHDVPVGPGTLLQLPVYVYAARAAYSAPGAERRSLVLVRREGQQRAWSAIPVDAAVDEVFARRCARSSTASKRACSSHQPPEPKPTPFIVCQYCDPDAMGTTDRWREWERKLGAQELECLRSLQADVGANE